MQMQLPKNKIPEAFLALIPEPNCTDVTVFNAKASYIMKNNENINLKEIHRKVISWGFFDLIPDNGKSPKSCEIKMTKSKNRLKQTMN